MADTLEVLFAPAEFEALAGRDLTGTECVVFDVLRATSTMVVALLSGATALVPVAEIPEALRLRREHPDILLAGEREGVRIRAELTGGTDFDLGNSPREFTRDRVAGKTIVTTTTNGTRALRACRGAKAIWVSSLLNLGATAKRLESRKPQHLLLVCSGTHDQAAYEDILAAGGLCDLLWTTYAGAAISDSARVARRLFCLEKSNLAEALSGTRNGRRLMSLPELSEDVPFCARLSAVDLAAQMGEDGMVRALT